MALALNCGIPSTPQGRELVQHGSALFPIACYEERLTCYSVPWHWHEDFEYILAYEGTVTVGVDKKRICLAEGEGVFINSGVLHAVEFAAEGPSVLRSGVFHPRLVGGIDTIYWQKLIRPLLQPGVPSYFLLSKGEPWQAEVLARLWEAWHAVDEEPDDYENRVRYLLSAALHTRGPLPGGRVPQLPAGAGGGPAHETDAAFCGGTLCRGTDRGTHCGQCGPERKRLPAQFPAAAGYHAHPVCETVPH